MSTAGGVAKAGQCVVPLQGVVENFMASGGFQGGGESCTFTASLLKYGRVEGTIHGSMSLTAMWNGVGAPAKASSSAKLFDGMKSMYKSMEKAMTRSSPSSSDAGSKRPSTISDDSERRSTMLNPTSSQQPETRTRPRSNGMLDRQDAVDRRRSSAFDLMAFSTAVSGDADDDGIS
ncbi:hypothetical protein CYMTET_10627 [Cymbomonas tetramitiformis]|uniref:Uncharacterized protein n=1 Tax=Cymbomonas tetramitiformis TaxID=36881 RepID=A0AAE0GNV7_9CHLO|nr:hypothetical protein CYMTET_10627 [Cymbomonas tetramitiformis]